MNDFYSEDEVLTTVIRLTRTRLTTYVKAGFVYPARTESGPVYSPVDLARMELICDLSEQFDLEGEALAMVLSLIDQLHGVRAELRAFAGAVDAQPPQVREKITAVLTKPGRLPLS